MQHQHSVMFWLGCTSAGIAGCLLLTIVLSFLAIPWMIVAYGAFQRRTWTCPSALIMILPTVVILFILIGCHLMDVSMHGKSYALADAVSVLFGLFAVPFVTLTLICFLTPVERR